MFQYVVGNSNQCIFFTVHLAAPVFAQTQEAFPSYIQVNGRSQMEVTPDEFYLSIVINERERRQ